jgi:hypothetical protein
MTRSSITTSRLERRNRGDRTGQIVLLSAFACIDLKSMSPFHGLLVSRKLALDLECRRDAYV